VIEQPMDLAWWPPDAGEPLGMERAEELVAHLLLVGQPVFDAAAADLRSRLAPGAEIVSTRASLTILAPFAFDDPYLQSLLVGMVSVVTGDPPEINSIQLGRDGVLRWQRE
jgi:hypothetical protein